jgi:hypothetical protein
MLGDNSSFMMSDRAYNNSDREEPRIWRWGHTGFWTRATPIMPSSLSFKEKARRFEATGPILGAPSCAPRRKR